MNALELSNFYTLLAVRELTETEAMNRLQQANIISDNCTKAEDIASEDVLLAMEFLRQTK